MTFSGHRPAQLLDPMLLSDVFAADLKACLEQETGLALTVPRIHPFNVQE